MGSLIFFAFLKISRKFSRKVIILSVLPLNFVFQYEYIYLMLYLHHHDLDNTVFLLLNIPAHTKYWRQNNEAYAGSCQVHQMQSIISLL